MMLKENANIVLSGLGQEFSECKGGSCTVFHYRFSLDTILLHWSTSISSNFS